MSLQIYSYPSTDKKFFFSKISNAIKEIKTDYNNWLSRWFVLFIYEKEKQRFYQPILYEEDSFPLIKRSKLLPEMTGLISKIEKLKKHVFENDLILTQMKKYTDLYEEPGFLFDFKERLVLILPYELKKINLSKNLKL